MAKLKPEEVEWWSHFVNPVQFAIYTDPFRPGSAKRYRRSPHLDFIGEKIAEAAFEGNRFIILNTPPRHGKSRLVSQSAPAWYLELFPDRDVIMTSHSQELATKFGREVRNTIIDNEDKLTVRLSPDSKAKHRWNTQEGGGMVSIGVEGGITGFGAHLILIDDPFKTRLEAESPTYRQRVWDWWTDTLSSRLEPNGSVVIIMQRWHGDDLVGRLIEQMKTNKDDPDQIQWEVINLPAIIETPEQAEACPLGREIGTPLWPERYTAEALAKIKATTSSIGWASQYQQKPTPDEGALFRRKYFRYFTVKEDEGHLFYVLPEKDADTRVYAVEDCAVYLAVDTAMKAKTQHDWTAFVAVAVTPDGDYLVIDVVREKLEIPEQYEFVMAQRARHPLNLWMGIEDKQSGTGLIQEAERNGIPILSFQPVTDKVDRATTAGLLYKAGKIRHRQGASWQYAFEEELLQFPSGAHDDQVDPLSYLVRELGGGTPGICLL